MSGKRKTLSVKTNISREEQQRLDWEALMLNQGFLRTLFTILSSAGMFSNSSYQPVDAAAHFAAGRRGLGFDILRTAEKYLGPDALISILEAEKKTLKETSNDRSGTDHDDERRDELGGSDDERAVVGPVYLSYDSEQSGSGSEPTG